MKTFKEYITEADNVLIEKTSIQDIEACAEISYKIFITISKEDIDYEMDRVDWNESYKATINDTIIGCILLTENSVTEFDYCETEDLSSYKNKSGIEIVLLCVLPEFRNLNIGRKLRDIPLHLGYDYEWAQHFYSLANKDQWVKFGNRVVADDKTEKFFVTLMDLK